MELRSGRQLSNDSKLPSDKITSARSRRSGVRSREIASQLFSEAEKTEIRGKRSKTNSGFRFYLLLLLATAFLVLVVVLLVHNLPWVAWKNADRVKNYIEGVTKLAKSFPAQNARLWDILRARGKAHLNNTSPSRPLIFMVAAPPDGHEVASCLATKLAGIIDPPAVNRLLVIDGEKYDLKSQGQNAKKAELDNLLAEHFRNNLKVALIKRLEALPLSSLLLFYSYCDDQNAPFKDVAFIFTVLLPWFPDPSLTPKDKEGKVERYLANEVWKSSLYDENIVAGLLSRVADTVVFVRLEEELLLAKVCPKQDKNFESSLD